MPLKRFLKRRVTDLFHRMYYNRRESWRRNTFLGYQIWQNPLDLQLYQELVFRLRPDFIVQTGVAGGGSVLYFASILDLMKAPESVKVVGVDLDLSDAARTLDHPRIALIEGDSTSDETLARIDAQIEGEHGMVSLDSDHSKEHVLKELRAYARFVGRGSYLVVEDTNLNGHPVVGHHGDGPFEAAQVFLEEDRRFIRDDELWERNIISHHQYGWLKRVD